MENVLLICGAGASSGFLAQAIRKAAKKREVGIHVEARSEAQLERYLDKISVLLIGPHLAYIKEDLEKQVGDRNIVVEVIPQSVYGMLDGEKALDLILKITNLKGES